MPPTQHTLRFTARIIVEIEESSHLAQVLRDSLGQAIRAAVPAPPASGPSPLPHSPLPIREAVQITPVAVSSEAARENHLLDTKQVAKLLGICERTLWSYWNSGRILKPIKIGSSVRWSALELRQWIEAACPTYEEWVKMK
jgi:predicted DNA-binding transcriptional regulator AlpA